MSEDFDKYLAIANHDIQVANNMSELKSYVDSILWDNDKKVELLQQKENIIKEVREWLNKTIFYFDFEKEVTSHTFELLYTAQGQELLTILDKGE